MIRCFIVRTASLLVLFTMLLAGSVGAAFATSSTSAACGALNQIDSTQGCQSTRSTNIVGSTAKTVVSVLSLLIGVVAVIMVMIAGLKYITSNGDSNGVASAKTTLIYALAGLLIAALAQFLVHFVLSNVGTTK